MLAQCHSESVGCTTNNAKKQVQRRLPGAHAAGTHTRCMTAQKQAQGMLRGTGARSEGEVPMYRRPHAVYAVHEDCVAAASAFTEALLAVSAFADEGLDPEAGLGSACSIQLVRY